MKNSFHSICIYALLNQEFHSLKFQHITISLHSFFCTYLAWVNDRLADQSNVHFFL